jgi:hypothetical protein
LELRVDDFREGSAGPLLPFFVVPVFRTFDESDAVLFVVAFLRAISIVNANSQYACREANSRTLAQVKSASGHHNAAPPSILVEIPGDW